MSECDMLRTEGIGHVPQTAICSHNGSEGTLHLDFSGSLCWEKQNMVWLFKGSHWIAHFEKQGETDRVLVSLWSLRMRLQLASSDLMTRF